MWDTGKTEAEFYAELAAKQRQEMQAKLSAHPFIPPSWDECFGPEAQQKAAQKRIEEEAQRRENDPYALEKRLPAWSMPPSDPLRVEAMKRHFEAK